MNTPKLLPSLMVLAFCMLYAKSSMAQFQSSEFINPVPIPYLATGVNEADTTSISLFFEQFFHNFDPMGSTAGFVPINDPVTTASGAGNVITINLYDIDTVMTAWGINAPPSERTPLTGSDMTYLGPTLLWKQGKTTRMDVANFLPRSADAAGHGDSTTSHWHGLNVHAQGDGGPHQPITTFQTWRPEFPIVDSAQTLWYHSHVMEFTTEQVIRGISGMIIVEDTTDQAAIDLRNALPHEYGANDFPLIIQDKPFDFIVDTVSTIIEGGDTTYTIHNKATNMKVVERPGDGQFRIVNGVANGILKIPNSMVRFRVLNGDSRKSFNIGFSTNIDTSDHAARLPFYQVATDGGYMGRAYPLEAFLVNPGERGEFVVDFSNAALNGATEVFLSNLSSDPAYAAKDIVGLGGDRKNAGPLNPGLAFMKFVVDPEIVVPDPISSLPDPSLFPVYELQDCFNARARTKELQGGNGQEWVIDGTGMDMRVLNDTVCVNTCETWTIKNTTNVAHPFHIHKVQFQITEYIDRSGGQEVVYTYPNLPSTMMGYKDVIIVRQFSDVTFQARFDDFGADTIDPRNGYMYHCHILTHEDFSMMHQFTVVNDSICQALDLYVTDIECSLAEEFILYPNPTTGMLYLQGKAKSTGKLRITDILGRLLHEEEIRPFEGEMPVDVSHLAQGVIMVEYIFDNRRLVEKIVLE